MDSMIKNLLVVAIALLTPIHAIMISVFVLVFCDLILGILAARKRGESISSSGMRRTIVKILSYQAVIICGFLVETYMMGGILPLSKMLASLIGVVEMKSLLENADEIHGSSIIKKVISSSRQTQATDIKLFVSRDGVQIKIEASPVVRGVLYPTQETPLNEKVSAEFDKEFDIQISSLPDLYGGKVAAALDRQHPRDLFDVKLLLENEGLTEKITTGFLVYLMCHKRPPNELLRPTLLDQAALFDSDFKGMTNLDFDYADFVKTRNTLIKKINDSLTEIDKQFLLLFFDAKPDWSFFRESHAQDLPAIKWKLINLKKLDPEKISAQIEALKFIF